MTACERTGCEYRHIDDDGLCRCPWDGGEAHEMGDEMGEQERDPLDELREADRWKTKKFYDRIADSWQAERDEHEQELARKDEAIVKVTNNNFWQIVDSRDGWKKKAEAAKRSFEAISDTLDDVRDEVIRLEHERDELCESRDGLTDRCAELETEVGDLKAKLDVRETECASCIIINTNTLQKENADLKAKLDASIPLPLDADGVPCKPGDLMETDEHIPRKVVGYYLADESTPCVTLDFVSPSIEASRLHHVAPEPPDSQERIDADAKKSACEYFGNDCLCNRCKRYEVKESTCTRAQMSDLLRRKRELYKAGEQA